MNTFRKTNFNTAVLKNTRKTSATGVPTVYHRNTPSVDILYTAREMLRRQNLARYNRTSAYLVSIILIY
jgi:hypothetical protein